MMKVEDIDSFNAKVRSRSFDLVRQIGRRDAMHAANELFAWNDSGFDVLFREITAGIGRHSAVVCEISRFGTDEHLVTLYSSGF